MAARYINTVITIYVVFAACCLGSVDSAGQSSASQKRNSNRQTFPKSADDQDKIFDPIMERGRVAASKGDYDAAVKAYRTQPL